MNKKLNSTLRIIFLLMLVTSIGITSAEASQFRITYLYVENTGNGWISAVVSTIGTGTFGLSINDKQVWTNSVNDNTTGAGKQFQIGEGIPNVCAYNVNDKKNKICTTPVFPTLTPKVTPTVTPKVTPTPIITPTITPIITPTITPIPIPTDNDDTIIDDTLRPNLKDGLLGLPSEVLSWISWAISTVFAFVVAVIVILTIREAVLAWWSQKQGRIKERTIHIERVFYGVAILIIMIIAVLIIIYIASNL